MAETKAGNLLSGIAASREVPFERVLFALGIRHVGETVAKRLARHFGSMKALRGASRENLLELDVVGPVIADAVMAFFSDERHMALIDRLVAAGLRLERRRCGSQGTALAGISALSVAYSAREMKSSDAWSARRQVVGKRFGHGLPHCWRKNGPDQARAERLGVRILS